MNIEMDSLQFTSISEIEALTEVLEEWKELAGSDRHNNFVDDLLDKLDVLHMQF